MRTDKADWGDRYLAAMRWAIPPALRNEGALLTRAQNVVNAAIIAGLFGPLYALAYLWLGFDMAANETMLCCLVMLSAPLVLRCTGSILIARELFLSAILFNFTWLSYHLGGITAPTATWLLTAPVVAMFLGGVRSALCWLALSCAALVALYAGKAGDQNWQLSALHLLCCLGLLIVVTVFVLLFELTKTQGFVHLEQALRTINELAIRDELTGTHNRRHLIRLIERASERGHRFSLCLLDIDFFKHINDTWGHSAGDAVLRAFAQSVQSQVRPGDTFGRYGGEEFLLMLPDTGAASAITLAERVRLGIEQMRCDDVGPDVVVTVSIGVAQFRPGETISQAIGRADEALYQAKSAGRNRVACHGDTVVPPPAIAPPSAAGSDAHTMCAEGAQRARLFEDAHADLLTGLMNRRLLRERLQHAMHRADRGSRPLALLLININKFREINEAFGVAAGDAVLVHAGTQLRGALREGDAVARWGGDEFIAVLEDVGDELAARQVATKIIERFAAPLPLGNSAQRNCFITLSIGIALYPGADSSLDALLRRAEQALGRARTNGGHSIDMARGAGTGPQDERLALKDGLRTALAENQLLLEYQPQVDLATRRVIGVETLIRWQHPQFGRIEPARFIGLAEETGLIVPIGDWVLRSACAQHRAWVDAGLPAIKIAVNLSARQLKDPDLVTRILQLVAQAGISPRCLDLEITEGVLMDDLARNRRTLAALRAAGLQVSIDDFGTGYSSLNYLSELPIDILKMDGQFVRRLGAPDSDKHDERTTRALAIAGAIVTIAHKLELKVIAEAVETEVQYAALAQLGCDQAQGFLFHRPMHPDAVAALLVARPRLVVERDLPIGDLTAFRLP
ncbi:putative bifunctional diguanylate cyclase/phosphodiesterase [Massilia sp. S19_KUP03_FR1]|uniref:putative bifunctional diguanylate cyclase/phosphodiesterase n=1 Tax=Massilia sp. S19_KUP03_FR1 TaxID=3025503 RepID=UPI002FCDB307